MAVLQMVARLPSLSGLAEDTCENVFHMTWTDPPPTSGDLTAIGTAVGNFYDTIPTGGTNAVGEYINQSISRVASACSVLMYYTLDESGETPFGSPIGQSNFTLPAAIAGAVLPEEVAVVLTLEADLTDIPVSQPNPTPPPATIRPQSRRRGRIYVGPLQAAAAAVSGNHVRPVALFISDVLAAATDLGVALNAVDAVGEWGVWSKADEEVHPILGGWMDNAFDTQRRRGVDPTSRTTFSI